MEWIIAWLLAGLGIFLVALILPGVEVKNYGTALIVAIVLGLVNVFVRPFVLFLTFPINVLTLGLFTFVVNTLMVMLVSSLVSDFKVNSFWSALLFGIIVAIINNFIFAMIPY